MPIFSTKPQKYTPSRKVEVTWEGFRRGLNLILRPTELGTNEMSQADNIMLTGSGVPKGRWGTQTNFTTNYTGATGTIKGIGTFIQGSYNDIFALNSDGFVYKKNNTLSTRIPGQSWPSGSIMRSEQLGGSAFLVSENVPFTTYSGTNFTVFATIGPPTGVSATNISAASGPNRVSYKIVANSVNGGHTQPSSNYVLAALPNDLTRTMVKVFWSAPSAATLSGFEIYRGMEGNETFLAAVGPNELSFFDTGSMASETLVPPLTNTTGGVKSAFIKKYQNRLVMVDANKPSTLLITGIYPNHTSVSLMDGGGSVDIDPDSGDDITGVEVQPIADRIVVYKNRSSYVVKLDFVTVGSFYLLNPSYQPISTSIGCCNQDTIATVENDSFYFGRDGIYVTGYEPNFLNILRTNEVSARIRPYFAKLTSNDYATASAAYIDKKYILSFPDQKEIVVYDRERGCFAGIWKLPYGISFIKKWIDSDGDERWIIGCSENNKVYEFIEDTNNDDGTAILKTFRTNKESFGDWSRLSIVETFYSLFRAISGTISINILAEDRNGSTTNIKTFTITGTETAGLTGWGTDMWGTAPWGDTLTDAYASSGDELTRWGTLYKQVRYVTTEVTSNGVDGDFELLSLKMMAKPMAAGVLASSQRV